MSNNIPILTNEGITISTVLAKALFAFAIKKDPTRPQMSGIGFDDCMVAATDGATAARVHNLDVSGCNGAVPSSWNGRYWTGDHVEQTLKAAGKAPTITLRWDQCDAKGKFPPVSKAVPDASEHKIKSGEPISVCPRLLGRIEAISDALRGKRPTRGPDNAECVLVSAPGPLDPLVFEVRGFVRTSSSTALHGATTRTGSPGVTVEIVIMPRRL